jgi:hypothetical protein
MRLSLHGTGKVNEGIEVSSNMKEKIQAPFTFCSSPFLPPRGLQKLSRRLRHHRYAGSCDYTNKSYILCSGTVISKSQATGDVGGGSPSYI